MVVKHLPSYLKFENIFKQLKDNYFMSKNQTFIAKDPELKSIKNEKITFLIYFKKKKPKNSLIMLIVNKFVVNLMHLRMFEYSFN